MVGTLLNAGEVAAGISDLQELEIGAHVIQLHREIFGLHLDFENLAADLSLSGPGRASEA